MSTEVTAENQYGYGNDEVKGSNLVFGLNAGVAFLTMFQWIPNGGKDGAEQEAVEIKFRINETDVNYRQFPVTQAFGKDRVVITDPKAPEFKEAVQNFNSIITHIMHCFVDGTTMQKAMSSSPVKNFKDFIQRCTALLPANFSEIPLDAFLQYQWQLKEGQKRTFLELPKSMKYGKWLSKAMTPAPDTEGNNAKWTEVKVPNPDASTAKAIKYVDGAGNEHIFHRNGWYADSNFAKQQKDSSQPENAQAAQNIAQQQPAANATAGSTGSGW